MADDQSINLEIKESANSLNKIILSLTLPLENRWTSISSAKSGLMIASPERGGLASDAPKTLPCSIHTDHGSFYPRL